jgi:transaldolase
VFAGRIADSGIDPLPIMKQSLEILKPLPAAELLWASPRELLNLVQADQMGCHVITVTPALLDKASNIGKDLDQFSLETVKMFYNDAVKSGFDISET